MSALKSFAAGLLAVVGVIGGLDAKSVTSVFPEGWGGWISAAIMTCAALYHLLDGAGKAGSTTTTTKVSLLFLLCSLSMFLSSCAGVLSGVTGEAIPTVPVQRLGSDGRVDPAAKPFNAATADVLRAEANPAATWGLYNAGAVATAVSDTKKSSGDSSSAPPAIEIPVVDQK